LKAARDTLVYAVLTVVFTWPLTFDVHDAMPLGGDNQHLAWALSWVAHALATDPRSLFAGNIFFPSRSSLLFSDPNISSGLLVAPIYYATASPGLLVNVLFLASFLPCALAARALAREWTGSDFAGFVAGALFAFSPLRASHVDHVQLYPFWWMPLGLLGVDRYVRGGSRGSLALGLLCLVAQGYASIYLAIFAAAATALLLVLRGCSSGWAGLRRAVVAGVVLAIIGGVLCAPVLLGYLDLQRTWGASRSLAQNIRYSASPLAYVSAAPWNLAWGSLLAGYADPVAPWEKYLFPGFATVALAAASLHRPRSFAVAFGLVIAFLAVVASLGPTLVWRGVDTGIVLPYGIAYDWLPPLHALRGPSRWSLLASFGLAIAAGAGAARLTPRAAAVLVVLALGEALSIPLPTWALPVKSDDVETYRELASGKGALIELPLAPSEAERYQIESERDYASTLHWRPIANGYSGWAPPTYVALADLSSRLSPADFVALLPSWDIRTIVLDWSELSDGAREAWQALESDGRLRLVSQRHSLRVFEVTALPLPPPPKPIASVLTDRPLPGGSWQSLRIELASDHAALMPVEGLGWRRTTALWRDEAGASEPRRVKLYCPPAIGGGKSRYTMYFETPPKAGRYRLGLDGQCFDLPEGLEVTVEPPPEPGR